MGERFRKALLKEPVAGNSQHEGNIMKLVDCLHNVLEVEKSISSSRRMELLMRSAKQQFDCKRQAAADYVNGEKAEKKAQILRY